MDSHITDEETDSVSARSFMAKIGTPIPLAVLAICALALAAVAPQARAQSSGLTGPRSPRHR